MFELAKMAKNENQREERMGIAGDTSFVAKLIAEVPERSMPEARWPRHWRYLFVFGTALLFWVAVWLILRAI